MLVLFVVPAGYAIFKLCNEKKLKDVENISEETNIAEKAQEKLLLVSFMNFKATARAVDAVSEIDGGKISDTLKTLLKVSVDENEKLVVGDAKLGNLIKEELFIDCVHDSSINELTEGVRAHTEKLLAEHKEETNVMNIVAAQSLARYKAKLDPENIDTLTIRAVSVLDDIDKKLNNHVLQIKNLYGCHFPELKDHQDYDKAIKAIGMRQNCMNTDLSSCLPEELEKEVKEDAKVSMGNDISDSDVKELCDKVIELSQERTELVDYLKNRMSALAPNLTVLLGEVVLARMIYHAGSLDALAKAPSSTIQILGAEKTFSRSCREASQKNTPKYGIIYNAQLVTQAPPKIKGLMGRKLAAKCSLAARIDAFADADNEVGIKYRAALENELLAEKMKDREECPIAIKNMKIEKVNVD